jgi:excisionase family DNA binding protein
MAVRVRHEEQLVKPSEAARRIGVHHNTILNWIRHERIPYVRTPTGQYLLPWTLVVQSLSGTYDLSIPEPSTGLTEEDAVAHSRGR